VTGFNTQFQSDNKEEWETPNSIFIPLHDEFKFDLDVCADRENTKAFKYYTKEDNGLTKDWMGVCWMNPPFGDKKKWIKKAYGESLKQDVTVVCLVPARTNTDWWHDYCMKGEIRFIRGRPKFKGAKHGLPQPLAIVIFK
jgi:phage N-6-adenine-methyltransferase